MNGERGKKIGAGARRRVDPVVRTYGVGEVERLTGLSRVTLHVWDRTGFIRPSVSLGGRGTGNRRKYSFADVVALRVAKGFREAGISVRALRKAAKYLREREGVDNPFAERYLAVQGRDVVMIREDEAVSLLKRPGQYTMLLRFDLAGEALALKREVASLAA